LALARGELGDGHAMAARRRMRAGIGSMGGVWHGRGNVARTLSRVGCGSVLLLWPLTRPLAPRTDAHGSLVGIHSKCS
jgi:hypothetical protein